MLLFALRGRGRSGALLLGLAFLAALVWTGPVLAQAKDTGTISVRANDPDGASLPGVMVVIRGPLGTRTEYTGADGTTRFPGLTPGMYSATFSLDGFKTVVREELRVSVGRTILVDVDMELSAVEETITVTGESPVVDVKSTNVGNLYTDELIDYAPTASGIWAGVLDHVPGLVNDEIDVGGGESGQQAVFSARGSGWLQNTYNINGANTTDPDALGASSMYYSISSFEEVGVSTGSHDMENSAPGVVLNMVSKTGSNDWHGAAKFFYENEDLVSNNVDAELEAEGVEEGNPNTLLRDFDAQVGGPILRDRAWFFVDYWDFKVERRIIGLPPDEVDDTSLENWTLNGTWQINESHKASLRYFTDRKFRGNRGASRTTPPETAWIQDSFVDIPQAQYQGVLGPNTFVDFRFSKMDMEFPLEAKDADSPAPHPNFPVGVPPTQDLATGLRSGEPEREVFFQRDRTQFNGTVSYYATGESQSHDLKFGGEYAKNQSFAPDKRGGSFGFTQRLRNGVPDQIRLWNVPTIDIFTWPDGAAKLINGDSFGLFAQDSMTLGNRLTINGGVRWDWSNSYIKAQRRLESNFPSLGEDFQELQIQPVDDVTKWSDIVPRVGAILDVTGDGRTALKFNYSRYAAQQGVWWAWYMVFNNPGSYFYTWDDPNGDGMFQFGEQDTLLARSIPGSIWDMDPDLEAPLTDEFVVGAERELVENFLLSASFIWRDTDKIIDDINDGVPYGPIIDALGLDVADPYTPVQVTDPGPDGALGTADDGGPLTIFSQDPSTFGQGNFLITNVEKFGLNADEQYRGLSLVAHKRWSDNWQVLASWDIGKAETTQGSVTNALFGNFDNPNADINNEGRSPWDRTHLVKVTGNYLIPQPIGVNLGTFIRYSSGQPLARDALFGAADGLEQGTIAVQVEPRGEHSNPASVERHDSYFILDFRAEKQFDLGRFGVIHGYFDAFNVTNENTVTSMRTRSGSTYGLIFAIIPPRVLRVGAAWDF